MERRGVRYARVNTHRVVASVAVTEMADAEADLAVGAIIILTIILMIITAMTQRSMIMIMSMRSRIRIGFSSMCSDAHPHLRHHAAIALIARCACRPVLRASTFVTVSNWSASHARSASTPATR